MAAGVVRGPVELTDGVWEQLPGTVGEPALWLVRTEAFRAVAARLADAVLDGAEKERAAALRVAGDRDTYLAGHVGLRLLLSAYLGVPPVDVPLGRLPCPLCGQPHGRPVVRDSPLHFSLSHSGGLCLLAFAPASVGVDIEVVPALEVAEDVGGALHPQETAELSRLRAEHRPAHFARVWARKEAYLKGLGVGLGRSMALDYLGAGPEEVAQVPGWTIEDVAVDDGYAAAVALQAENAVPGTDGYAGRGRE
ncbi:4'-phosphopantetheinyl transferase superfamily protein [Streptomyces sp. BR123]|uniref:4'-phosphopantetheinyl transferase family protein n=1 Tax=Streptomyces sp. BR123 TaxID=2749828 RepID=UPI0015C48B04|nr:4'-phosphopantetheinyl transferase superfamily protein [Streptomyces sp. BR123]NXY95064.1 4'-phosphopantetheinyl transferase superfamily protein [Streptomyces sp. BR123]